MNERFDQAFWDDRWREGASGSMTTSPPNPYLVATAAELTPGSALDAGCGSGAEAIWLAAAGWKVTAVDIAAAALDRARERASRSRGSRNIEWLAADLTAWVPSTSFDLVTTHYAHPAMPQLDFYDRIAGWVAPGGTLLVVGHLHTHDHGNPPGQGGAHEGPPPEASTTAVEMAARLEPSAWEVVRAEEPTRTVTGAGGRAVPLDDVVLRAVRLR